MPIPEKVKNFLYSYGLIFAGLLLVFGNTVNLNFGVKENGIIKFPSAGGRQDIGGDLAPANLPQARPVIPLPKNSDKFDYKFTAVSVFALDDKTDTVLFQKNETEVRPLASITKLVSALVLLDLPLDWSATATITADDFDNSSHFVDLGETFTLDDLWHVALIGSSNSAVRALVRSSGLTAEQFAERMNKKAKELGMQTAAFTEPTGLSEKNAASAEDMAKLLKEALHFQKIYKTLQIGEYYAKPLGKKPRRVWTTDWLLTNWIPNDFKIANIAGKTGYINDSKYNFAVRLSDDEGHALRIVVLGAASNEARFTEARDLAGWLFGRYLWPDQDGYNQLAD